MTREDEELHGELQRLFDDTAQNASGPTLTKLGARAADVPRLARRSRLLPRWAWGPLLGGAAGALVCGLAWRGAHRPAPVQVASVAVPTAPAPSVALGSASNAEPDTAAPRFAASDEAGESPELLGDADEGARFDVSGPQSDRDLDAWLAATKELSGGT